MITPGSERVKTKMVKNDILLFKMSFENTDRVVW